MVIRHGRTLVFFAGILVLGLTWASVAAQAPQGPPQQAPIRTAQQQFKNIQVLNDIPANQMNLSMHLIAGQLGVGCQYCHVWEQWDREDRPQKQIARRMMIMTNDINRNSFGGARAVTCFTCHQGRPKPVSTVVLPSPVVPRFDDPPPPPAPALPTVDQILSKYVQALGGEQNLRKVTSRVITGKRNIPTGPGGIDSTPAEVEIFQKAPGLTLNVYRTEKFTISDGFDGTTAWAQTVAGAVNDLPTPDQGRVKRTANFHEPLEMKQNYARMSVRGVESVGRRQAYVVLGVLEDDTPEQLYFDTQTGLLLRRATFMRTPLGDSPFEIDFDDYRDAGGGTKIPYVVRMNPAGPRTELGTSSTLRIEKIRNGVSIDDSRFVKPQPRPRPPAPVPAPAPAPAPAP